MKEIALLDFLKLVLKKAWILILAVVVCASIGFSYCTFMITPEYSSKAVLVVTVGDITGEGKNTADYSIVLAMMPTYVSQFKESSDFYEIVSDRVNNSHLKERNGDYSGGELKGMTSWAFTEQQMHVSVSVTGTNQNDVQLIIEAINENADNYLRSVFPTTITKSVSCSERASLSYPNTATFTVMAAIFGAVLAVSIIYIIEITNTTIESEEDLAACGFTVLGVVPDLDENKKGGTYRE